VRRFLKEKNVAFRQFNENELMTEVAEHLAEGRIVGWFQGRMEFGPRALGARSILGDPRSPMMQSQMNLKIKFRESFRPFAPVVMQEHAKDWFDFPADLESPYMLLIAPVRGDRLLPVSNEQSQLMTGDPDLCKRVNVPRSTVPAITHVDNTARLQTVDQTRNPRFHRLLQAFHERTGCPVLVNTSFNIRGEPIVCTPEDAYRCFQTTDIDILVLEDCVVDKRAIDQTMDAAQRAQHRAQFALD